MAVPTMQHQRWCQGNSTLVSVGLWVPGSVVVKTCAHDRREDVSSSPA